MAINLYTPVEIMQEIARDAQTARLSLELSQAALASRSGVSLGSIKRFEATGQISLQSLLKLALVLGVLEQFLEIFKPTTQKPSSIDELLKADKPSRKRGRKK